MTNEELQDSAKCVLNWAVSSYCQTLEELIATEAKETGRLEAEREWEKVNPYDGVGGFSQNPFGYGKDYAKKEIDRLREDLRAWSNIKEFVMDKICKQIGTEEKLSSQR